MAVRMLNRLKTTLCVAVAAAVPMFAVGCADSSKVEYSEITTKTFTNIQDLAASVEDSVVAVSTSAIVTSMGQQYIVSGAGSGVVLGVDGSDGTVGYIVTNNHVIENAEEVSVTFANEKTYSARIIGADAVSDIAVLKVDADETLTIAVWGDSDNLRVGESTVAVGNPLGTLGGTVTAGVVSALQRQIVLNDYQMTLIQTDTAINPGNSGGALFNMNGQVIGIVNSKTTSTNVEGICFAIPSNEARAVFGDIVEYGKVKGRPSLGVTMASASSIGGLSNFMYIYSIASGGAAAKGGLSRYDRIYAINDTVIDSLAAFNAVLYSNKAGDTVTVEYYDGVVSNGRLSWDNELKTAEIVLDEA